MDPVASLARRLWESVEPLHALVYFAPEPAEAVQALGIPSWWMGYFTGRVAPLGAPEPAAVTAMLFGFAPSMVGRAIPDAWAYATPEDVLQTRLDAARRALERVLPSMSEVDLVTLVELLERAVEGCRYDGCALAASWAAVRRPADLTTRLWLATTVLREHRGDGHVIACVHAGLRGLDATLTHIATGDTTRDLVQPSRGWTDEDWESSRRRLVARGWLTQASRLTKTGGDLRRRVEEATDRLAADPIMALGESGVEQVIALAAPLSRHLIDSGAFPVPNPIGAPRP